MSEKKSLKLILKSVGLELVNYGFIVDCVDVIGYEFEAYKDGKFQFSVEAYSFDDAVKETMQCILRTQPQNLIQ
jgi:hypothetical protein